MRSARILIAVVAIAVAAGAAGCGGSGGSGSCTLGESIPDAGIALSICEEVTGASDEDLNMLRQSCMLPGGLPDAGFQVNAHYSDGPCSRVGALGGCRVTSGGLTATVWYYAAGGGTSADIETLCTQAGTTFVPP